MVEKIRSAVAFCLRCIKGSSADPKGIPFFTLQNPQGMDRSMRRLSLDALKDLNEIQANELGHPRNVDTNFTV